MEKFNLVLKASMFMFILSFFPLAQADDIEIVMPLKLIQQSTEKVISYMETAPSIQEAKERHAFVVIEKEVLPYLDFLAMTKLAVGKYWKRSNKIQQDALYQEFEKLLTKTYVKVFAKFSNLKVNVLPFKEGRRPDRALVKTEVIHQNGGKTSIDYKFRLVKEKHWMVYDIKVEGISLVTNYRTSFSTEIARSGVDSLIRLLKDKNLN